MSKGKSKRGGRMALRITHRFLWILLMGISTKLHVGKNISMLSFYWDFLFSCLLSKKISKTLSFTIFNLALKYLSLKIAKFQRRNLCIMLMLVLGMSWFHTIALRPRWRTNTWLWSSTTDTYMATFTRENFTARIPTSASLPTLIG